MTTAAPLPDDNMEMSSPAHHIYDDDDIDIDFDDNIGGVDLTDDDRMADDTEQPRPGTATDDMMEDDAPEQNAQAPEQEMQDDFNPTAYEQGDPDDELIDYSDDELEDVSEVKDETSLEPPAPEITLQDREPTDPDFEQVDEEIVREPETSAPAQEVVVEASAPEVVNAVLETSAPELIAAPVADESFVDADEGTGDHNDVETDANAAADDVVAATDDQHRETTPVVDPVEEPFPELPEDSPELKAVAPIPAPIETNLDAGDDAPATPTDTGLHPMFVQYGDWIWPLFKSRKQPEGLLKDDNLASVALADLLISCRSRLALKAGEDISEDQEFVLRFDNMGLTIIENSPSAFNASLDEVLAVFRQLHINDGAQSIPPFWILLSLQIKPSSYLTMLKQGAAVGQRMSDFVPVTDDEPGEDYEYPQDGDEDPTLLGDGSGVEYGDQQERGHQPHAEPEVDEADPDEYDASHEEKTQGGQEPQDTQDQYGQYTAAEQAEYEAEQAELEAQQAEDQTQQAVHETQQAGPETREDNEAQHADVAAEHTEEANDARQSEKAEDTSFVITDDVAVDPSHEVEPSAAASAPEVTNNPTGEARDAEDQDQDTAETSNAEPASSSTMPPTANDSVGNHSEYQDEDLIDWDDNLTHRPSEHDADDTDDYSKFLAEESANSETANKENPQTLETDNTNVVTGDHAAGGHDDTVDPAEIDLEDEDFEHHSEDVDQEVPTAEAVDADANGEVQEQPETQTTANGAAHSAYELRVTPEAKQPQAEVVLSKDPVRNEEDYIDFSEDEDGIDFDDDTLEEHEARMASEAGSKSPPGKRSLDDAGDDDQPELKKVKSS